jgi:hypothetical protein
MVATAKTDVSWSMPAQVKYLMLHGNLIGLNPVSSSVSGSSVWFVIPKLHFRLRSLFVWNLRRNS